MFSTRLPRTGRRDVLKLLGGGVAAGAGVGFWNGPVHADGNHFDCIVAGGGMSGLFTAWRLSQQGRSVALFEASDRLGGRLLSVQLPGMDVNRAEIGGMRHTSHHRLVVAAVERFIGDEGVEDFDYQSAFSYLRGQRLAPDAGSADLPYSLNSQERAMVDEGQHLLEATIRPDLDAALAGDPALVNQGLWTYLLERRSNEGFNFIRDELGYYSILKNWNAADAIGFLGRAFHPDQAFYRLKNGFEALPHAIARDAMREGAEIHLSHRLSLVERNGDGTFTVSLDGPDGAATLSCDSLVLAMPKRSIEMLDPDCFFLSDDRFAESMHAITAGPLAKIHLAFDTAWWEGLGIDGGKSITDLPIRQTYYWGKEADGQALLMASYHDGQAIDFWQGLTGGRRFNDADWAGGMKGPNGEPLAPSLIESLPASEAMVEEVLRQLKESHGIAGDMPRPYAATYKNWGDDPYGGGWYRWKVGENSARVMDHMRRPFADTRLHVCGDAWSHDSGWVEGALATAETMLVQDFGLPAFAAN